MPKLVFLHTAPALVDEFDRLVAELAPTRAVSHVVREDLLKRAIDEDGATEKIIEEAVEALLGEGTRDVEAVICTCSTIGEAADRASRISSRPIFRIDRPMARRSVEIGQSVLVLATVATTLAPTSELVMSEAQAAGRRVSVQTRLLDGARALFLSGRRDDYLEAVAAGITAATLDADVVVLAQASMAAVLPRLGETAVPVLTSPRLGLEAILRELTVSGRLSLRRRGDEE